MPEFFTSLGACSSHRCGWGITTVFVHGLALGGSPKRRTDATTALWRLSSALAAASSLAASLALWLDIFLAAMAALSFSWSPCLPTLRPASFGALAAAPVPALGGKDSVVGHTIADVTKTEERDGESDR